jgi:ATP-dependent helicase HrpB
VARRAALAAALLSERDPFLREDRRGGAFARAARGHESESDVVDRVAALEEFAARGTTRFECGELHRGRADCLLRGAAQIARLAGAAESARPTRPRAAARPLRRLVRPPGAPARAGLAARRDGRRARRAARATRAPSAAPSSSSRSTSTARATTRSWRMASAVERGWLDRRPLATTESVRFERERGAVAAFRVTRFDDLVLEEKGGLVPDPEESARVLAAAAAEEVTRALGLERDEVAGFVRRVNRLRDWMPELALPRLDDAWFAHGCPSSAPARAASPTSRRCRSSSSCAAASARARARDRPARARAPHRPERQRDPARLPARGRAGPRRADAGALRWARGRPRIAGGRVAVVLHLLAPNHRPQQVTQDLASFWTTSTPGSAASCAPATRATPGPTIRGTPKRCAARSGGRLAIVDSRGGVR